jgi:hypothetical protein
MEEAIPTNTVIERPMDRNKALSEVTGHVSLDPPGEAIPNTAEGADSNVLQPVDQPSLSILNR